MNIDEGVVVHFRVLGPLLVEQEEVALSSISALMLRRLLAGLLTRPNECVSVDDLMSALWGQSAPPAARRTLLVYIRRLRSALGDEARIVHAPAGYRIVVHDGELDCVEFGHLLSNARATTGERAADLLAEALKLWRGKAYEDVREHFPIADEARSLDEERVQAEARHAELKLELGQHTQLIPRLTKLIEAHPFNEDFRRHLMLALYRCGRQSDALEIYRSTRVLLDDELGVEPSLALRRLHEAILRSDTSLELRTHPTDRVPRELPADISSFVGRAQHLQALNEMLPNSSPIIISAIAGSAGVGKTALAVHWAHSVADRFPDGQLYINLCGFDPAGAPMGPQNAIRRFLDTLGVAPQRIPTSLEAQASLYRSLLAGKRTLVLLDNAYDAEQVRPLLPGSSTSFVVITSRNSLASLVATSGARPLLLDVLTIDEARSLLAARLGRRRIDASPGAVERIISRCARLPLALAIAAAHAATQPNLTLDDLAAEIISERAFDSDDPATDLHAVFSWSYKQLSEEAARLFRLLGLHSGPDFSTAAARSLAGQPIGQALTELAQAHMVTERKAGRFAFHDLLRNYAMEQALAIDSEADRRLALERLLDHYVNTAEAADRLLNPHRQGKPALTPIPLERLSHHDEAMNWLITEHAVLLSAIRQAEQSRLDNQIPRLAENLAVYFDRRGCWHDMLASHEASLAASQRLGDKGQEAKSYRYLARANSQLGRTKEAENYLQIAVKLYQQLGDHIGQGDCHMGRASIYELQGRNAKALGEARQSYEHFRKTGFRVGQANALNSIGWFLAVVERPDEAAPYCQQALTLLQDLGDHEGAANTLDSLAYIYQCLGDYEQAIAYYKRTLDAYREVGHRYHEAHTLVSLGDIYEALGHHSAVHDVWQQALDIFVEIEHRDAEEIRTRLERLDQTKAELLD